MAAAGDRRRFGKLTITALIAALVIATLASLSIGPSIVPIFKTPEILLSLFTTPADQLSIDQIVVLQIRAPRTVLAILVGAALAVSGAMLQSLFRNPLADPGLIGVSSGASLGAVAGIVLGGALSGILAGFDALLVPFTAFTGGLIATSLLYAIATRDGRTSVASMLLAGVALGALAGSLTSFMVFLADDGQLRNITFWLLGGLGGATWAKLAIAAPLIGGCLIAAPFIATGLDRLVLGEAAARHLGTNTEALKRMIFALTALSVGVAVSFSGVIGFVGVIVPHLLRLVIGPGHRNLIPASACLGATLLLIADIVCRTVAAPAEMPLGILTAMLGAPFFMIILLRKRGVVDL